MSYSHSRKPDLPVTHSSPLSMWLSQHFLIPCQNHAVKAGLWVLLVAAVTLPFFSNERGTAGNLSDLTVASSQYDILFSSQPFSQICFMCRCCWIPISVALSCCVRATYLGPVGWRHMYEMVMEHFDNPNLSVVVAKCWFLGFVV